MYVRCYWRKQMQLTHLLKGFSIGISKKRFIEVGLYPLLLVGSVNSWVYAPIQRMGIYLTKLIATYPNLLLEIILVLPWRSYNYHLSLVFSYYKKATTQ